MEPGHQKRRRMGRAIPIYGPQTMEAKTMGSATAMQVVIVADTQSTVLEG